VLAAGLPPQWLEGAGVAIENLRTRMGAELLAAGPRAPAYPEGRSRLAATTRRPVFVWPGEQPPGATRLTASQ